ncbi:Hypothetical predicted protein [Cloeon dipterum]|uniref:Uncharacterized protein n=1 Tax=Cloeon dipterum TaxID=197152 RepID=A0A8S1CU90_9INSE|nr:Hypothetical predicted protein [Cloeon dipterum]
MLSSVALVAAAILLSSSLGEAKTKAEWEKIEEMAMTTCIKELNLDKELGPNFNYDSLDNYTKVEQVPLNIRCLFKCSEEKFTGQSMTDMKKYLEKGMDYYKDMFKNENWSASKIKDFTKEVDNCNARALKNYNNNCDIATDLCICEMQVLKKFEKIK